MIRQLTLAAILGVLCGDAVVNAAEIKELRSEYRTSPLGIDIRSPRLSWIIQSDRRGEMQTAYQVLVASSPDLLGQDKGDLWDSGKVDSDRSTQIEYSGKPLASHQPAYWKVKVWDAKGGTAVSREPASWSMGFSSQTEWKAKWIGRDDARSSGPGNGQEKFLPATYLRREFTLEHIPARAVLYITSLGVAEPHLNGSKVGEDCLSPGWTDFNKRVYYRAYDVTARLKPGANVLGAILGDGWYRGHLSIIGQNIYGSETRLLAQLHLFFADGSSQVIASDATWKGAFGPVLEADIYAGETYDARMEIKGWDEPGFGGAGWKPVDLGARVNPAIQANPGEPVRRTGDIRTVAVTRPKPGLAVYDYGRNFSGWARLRITAPSGTRIVMRFGEMLNPDGTVYRKNLRAARATDTYVCKGVGEEAWEPRFTYHGFRYVEVEGLPETAGPEALTGIIVGSALPLTGNFECSDAIMTRTAANERCTIRANLVELPTDCPQRDERMGWTDYHEVVASTLYEQDAASLLTKWMGDLVDARSPDGAFPMIAPDIHRFPWSPGWSDSGVLIPWTMYFVYGDTRLAARYYHEITGHLETYKQQSKGFLVRPAGLGDWLAPDASTPKELIGTALYARCAEAMAEMGRALGKPQDAAAFAELHRSIRGAFQKKFIAPDGTIGSDSQGGYVLALAYDLLEPEQARQAADKLVAAIEKRGGHLSTGMVTTHLLLPALSKAGRTDAAYRLLAKTTFPSWGYFLQMGAASMWERWDAKTEKGYHPDGMNSFNHANLGTCTEWFYRNVLGIDAAEPGFGKLLLKPEPGGNLSWARGYYDSQHGRIASDWKIENGQFVWNVQVPANTTATVHVPAKEPASVTEGGKPLEQVAGLKVVNREPSQVVVEIGSGSYEFRSRW
jgi:alpha-L-rhamnosidase